MPGRSANDTLVKSRISSRRSDRTASQYFRTSVTHISTRRPSSRAVLTFPIASTLEIFTIGSSDQIDPSHKCSRNAKSGVQDSSRKDAVSKTVEGLSRRHVIGWTVTGRRFRLRIIPIFVAACDISRLFHRSPSSSSCCGEDRIRSSDSTLTTTSPGFSRALQM